MKTPAATSPPSPVAEALASGPALRFEGVGKCYGVRRALGGIDLSVREGECFGLVGENGAGKTTLIRCLLDFCEMDEGQIKIFGTPSELVPARSALAYLPERFNPPFYLTGRDYLRYMASLHGVAHDEQAAQQAATQLDLDVQALAQPARQYSKGMAQKLALAACMLSGKRLYVLDEPTAGLDAKAHAIFRAVLGGLRASGKTVFLASHDLADVESLCDRIAVMQRGSVRFIGTPHELKAVYARPTIEDAFLACLAEHELV